MKVKFVVDKTVEAQGKIVETFKAGQVYELSHASARRWIRRLAATEVLANAELKSAAPAESTLAEAPRPKRKYTRRKPPITAKKQDAEKEAPLVNTETSSE